jgi:predicted nucleic acid-binding protein
MIKTLVDCGPLVAVANRNDEHHDWAKEAFSHIKEKELYTTEAVIVEAVCLLRRERADFYWLLEQINQGFLKIPWHLVDMAIQVKALMRQYAPKMDLADATLVVAAQNLYEVRLVTLDRTDFEIYRLFGRHTIPLIAPER